MPISCQYSDNLNLLRNKARLINNDRKALDVYHHTGNKDQAKCKEKIVIMSNNKEESGNSAQTFTKECKGSGS